MENGEIAQPVSITRNTMQEDLYQKIISDEVSVYAIPKEIVYMDKLPKTDVGKTDSKYLENIK